MTVVAEVASFLAYRAARTGVVVDRRLVETAALLHDVDKALPAQHPLRALGHGVAGAVWLSEAGHPELARTLMAHPVTRLTDADAATWVSQGPLEERIVTYADKRATQRVVSLEQRFERWRRKHPEYRDKLDQAFAMACRLEAGLCAVIGIEATDVERLRWVDDAMTRAVAKGSLPLGPDSASVEGSTVPASSDPTAAA